MYRIIFRTCDKVNSLHNAPRPFGLEKRELIKLCFASLLDSLKGFSYSIHVIADDLSPELTSFFKQYDVTMVEGMFGNDESLRQSFRIAFEFEDNDWVYLCEDDYLHVPHAFRWIDELIENRKGILRTRPRNVLKLLTLNAFTGKLSDHPLFIHPPDYPDRYKARERRPSYLFLADSCHWRQISNTTFSFLAEAKSLRKFRSQLEHSCKGADDGYLSKAIFARSNFYGKALCVSPIPGISTHMHDGVMTPLVDWRRRIEELGTIVK